MELSSFPDVFVFSLLSVVSHYLNEWNLVEVSLEINKIWLGVGTVARVGRTKRRSSLIAPSNNMGTIDLHIKVSGRTYADTVETDRDAVLDPVVQMLSEVEGLVRCSVDEKGRCCTIAIPCTILGVRAESSAESPSPPRSLSPGRPNNGLDRDHLPAPALTRSENRPLTVLVVDDSSPIQKIMGKWLALNKCEVRVASNGKVGLEHMQHAGVDVVFMDFLMPVMGGVEAISLFHQTKDEDIHPLVRTLINNTMPSLCE
jgi:CheY-like chemotaxis protein